ncbi:MAG TPA: dUTP diphosphatase [Chloroflexi bacterium]|nr:dUTP diphosphatase [Chloroflexota bacterium]
MPTIRYQRLHEKASAPEKASTGAIGRDLCATIDEPLTLRPQQIARIPTGLAVEIPDDVAMLIVPRSGLASRGIVVLNSPGLPDWDYRGEIQVILGNVLGEPYTIAPGERIAQVLFTPIIDDVTFEICDNLSETERGAGGFGSTGRRMED